MYLNHRLHDEIFVENFSLHRFGQRMKQKSLRKC